MTETLQTPSERAGTTIDGFETMPSRLVGEVGDRLERASRKLKYFVAFLDDYLRGILPNDLVLLGAPSGMGKTDLALSIAASNADAGRFVHYYALEAEPRELERRTKYSLLVRKLYENKHPQRERMNYTDWLLGDLEDICGDWNRVVDQQVLERLSRMRTYYRGAKFDAEDLQRSVLEVHKHSALIVVDHLHYIDSNDENEHKALGDTVKTIRDVSLRIGVPILLVAHLRKRDARAKQLVATLDDFHGSSNITKIATQVIAIERAHGIEADRWWKSPTFMSVVKDRRSGACPLVALTDFDVRVKGYPSTYTLGRISGGVWEQISMGEAPTWSRHHLARVESNPMERR
jgi:replicative DNA helicase